MANETDRLLEKISDYRSGYSCGYSDAKNGTRMRDTDAATAFFGLDREGSIPDVLNTPDGDEPATNAPPATSRADTATEPARSTDFAEARDALTELLSRPSIAELLGGK